MEDASRIVGADEYDGDVFIRRPSFSFTVSLIKCLERVFKREHVDEEDLPQTVGWTDSIQSPEEHPEVHVPHP